MNDWINWYKKQGINLFPLRKEEETPLVPLKKFKRRKTTEREMARWLAMGIENFGAMCGCISRGLIVIDVAKAELFSDLGLGELADDTFTVRTGTGYHFYFLMQRIRKEKEALTWEGREEIRFQGEGKYIVIAGSRYSDGAIYEHLSTSPMKIERVRKPNKLFDEIKRRWRKYHDIEKLEEKREEIKLRTEKPESIEDLKVEKTTEVGKEPIEAEIKEEYIDKSNSVLSFVTNCIELEPNSFETKEDVYSAFKKFCKEKKLPSDIAKNTFGARLPQYIDVKGERRRIKGKQVRCWCGIRLKEERTDSCYSCNGCGMGFEDFTKLNEHLALCDDFQLMQAKEATGKE